ncbi:MULTISPECIES: phosphoribosyltransferase [Microbispora]|uniref:phosphoribosyltransferase n=1 Tax=Microbispora TaxID=2005 RepID=UPI0011C851E5|nr:phosphoribosyltransferase [Microbispora sp. CSR-4]
MMGDAEAFTRDFLPLFRAVPPARPGVCRICHSGPNDRADGRPWPICASCKRTTERLTGHTEHVVPISLTIKDTQLYDVLVRRREPAIGTARRNRLDFLAATLTHFFREHAACLQGLAGGPFTTVATIPSTRTERPIEAFHYMEKVIGKVGAWARLHRPLLLQAVDAYAPVLAARDSHPAAFRVLGDRGQGDRVQGDGVRGDGVQGARVLLVDDLFVSGAHVQSAASALIGRGARAVVALVIARLVNPASTDPYSAGIWQESGDRRFGFDRCCVCDRDRDHPAARQPVRRARG